MMNTNANNGRNNNNALETALEGIIKNCTNIVKLADMEKLAIGTSCEGEYVCSSENITEKLQKAKEEVERLENIIQECEEARKATEDKARKKKEQEEEFLNSLNNAGKEVMAYLKGLQTLAQGEKATLIENLLKVYKDINAKNLLTVTSNLSAYIAILVREEDRDTIDLLETVTCEVYNIKSNYAISAGTRVEQFNDVLLAIQDIY